MAWPMEALDPMHSHGALLAFSSGEHWLQALTSSGSGQVLAPAYLLACLGPRMGDFSPQLEKVAFPGLDGCTLPHVVWYFTLTRVLRFNLVTLEGKAK